MFAAIDTEREQTGRRPMGAATKQRVRATLRSALRDAEREGLVTVNVARLVRLEPGRRPPVRPLEPEELGRLLDHLASDELAPLYETIAATGLRRGEALGLRWADIDLDHGVISVRQQLVTLGRVVSFEPPKTASGARRIELDAHTTGVLLDQRLRQDADRQQWGDAYEDHGLVFARPNGEPLPPNLVTKRFGQLSEQAGVRRVRLHDLRHGAASLRLAAGVNIGLVSKILGHSTIGITADTYSHLLDGVGRDAAERAAALVPRAPRQLGGSLRGSRSWSGDARARVRPGERAGQRQFGWCPRWGSNPHWADFKDAALRPTVASTSDYAPKAFPTSPTSRPWSTSFHATNHATPLRIGSRVRAAAT
jgi:integrase